MKAGTAVTSLIAARHHVIRAAILCLGIAMMSGEASAFPTRDELLFEMSRVWHVARLFHPNTAANPGAWDTAFVQALEQMPAAPTRQEAEPILTRWLEALDDPVTVIATSTPGPASVSAGSWEPRVEVLGPRAYHVSFGHIPAASTTEGLLRQVKELRERISDARSVVIDLRSPGSSRMLRYGAALLVDRGGLLEPLLASAPEAPQARSRYHSGFASETAKAGSGGYFSGVRLRPIRMDVKPTGNSDARVVFITNRQTALPLIAVALQREGRAAIVSEDARFETYYQGLDRAFLKVGTWNVQLRTAEVSWDGGPAPATPDAVAPPERIEEIARSFLAGYPPRVARTAAPAPSSTVAKWMFEDRLPTRGERLFAAFKVWWVFNEFFAYRDLADRPWKDALAAALPRIELAATQDEYLDALYELLAFTDDGHTILEGPAVTRRFAVSLPLQARMVEGSLVVVARDADAERADVAIGDVIEQIDGATVELRLASFRSRRAVSTPANFRSQAPGVFAGRDGTSVRLVLRRGDGSAREVTLARKAWVPSGAPTAPPPVSRILPSGYGYVDLRRLEVAGVDAMFQELGETPAIIFDMRGYPRGTMWAIAPRLATSETPVAALFTRRVAAPGFGLDGDSAELMRFAQRMAPSLKARYRGRTVMLIDERAVSQSEHAGLFLRAANGTRFIGSPTTGANGDVTYLSLPGGLTVWMTGHAVTWPDGSQLQRRGIQPDVEVFPTLAGIRERRDEVLDKAIEFLDRELGKAR